MMASNSLSEFSENHISIQPPHQFAFFPSPMCNSAVIHGTHHEEAAAQAVKTTTSVPVTLLKPAAAAAAAAGRGDALRLRTPPRNTSSARTIAVFPRIGSITLDDAKASNDLSPTVPPASYAFPTFSGATRCFPASQNVELPHSSSSATTNEWTSGTSGWATVGHTSTLISGSDLISASSDWFTSTQQCDFSMGDVSCGMNKDDGLTGGIIDATAARNFKRDGARRARAAGPGFERTAAQ